MPTPFAPPEIEAAVGCENQPLPPGKVIHGDTVDVNDTVKVCII